MKYKTVFKALLLLPQARLNIKGIMHQLEDCNYNKLIANPLQKNFKKADLDSVVKSYFWATRTIKNCHCLPRSIALYHHLISIGLAAEHKFGVNKVNKNKKLNAHSWVELNGAPLNESTDLLTRFTVMEAQREK